MRKRQEGQSLLEVLVALAVMLIVILALVIAVTTAIKSSTFAKRKAQAANLAQEGMEKTRVYRDQNSWDTFSADCGNLSALGISPNPVLPFTRSVSCLAEASDKIKVRVIVSWTDYGKTQQSELISYFTKWP